MRPSSIESGDGLCGLAAAPPVSELRPTRILLHAPNPLGDAVMAEPAARAIAARFPDARIEVLISAPIAVLAETWPFVDEIWPVVAGGRVRERLDAIRLGWRLGRRGYDLAVLFPNSLRAAQLAVGGRASRVLAYAGHDRERLLTDRVPTPVAPFEAHMVAFYWGLAAALGCGPVPRKTELDGAARGETRTILAGDPRSAPRIRPTPGMHAAARDLLGRVGIRDDPFIAIAPGAAFLGAKCWPAERYGELCRRLAGELGWPCVLLGRRAERALGAAVHAAAGAAASTVDLTGRADVGMLLGILARARLFVGNDSGPAHVAAALGLPGVAIFGSTSDRHTGPVGHGIRIVQRQLPCAPCFQPSCPLGHLDCLRGLPVDLVAEAAHQALRGRLA
jgi:lipopolysaccharide heptosyltransferase II